MSQTEKQIGVRVDKQLLADFRNIVQHRHNGIRGPLGDAYENAMKLYTAHYFLTNLVEFERISENEDLDLDDDFQQRVKGYIETVEPDLEELYWEMDQKLMRPAQKHNSGSQQDRAVAGMLSSNSRGVDELLPTDDEQEEEETKQRETAASVDSETLVNAAVNEVAEDDDLVEIFIKFVGEDEDLIERILDHVNDEELAEQFAEKMSESEKFEDILTEKTG